MHQIKIGEYTIDVVRKDIKKLNLAVYPPHGRIRISVPRQLDDDTIRRHLEAKLDWIRKHVARIEQMEHHPQSVYASGESHYLEGRQYLLQVISDSPRYMIKIRENTYIDLYEKPGTPISFRPLMMQEWYRVHLKVRIAPLIKKWQLIIGVQIRQWAVKRMKTRWGTCNINAKRIWINLELAKRSDESLEYIIVHELMHLLERHHNRHFESLMDNYLPDWRSRKENLDRFDLHHEMRED